MVILGGGPVGLATAIYSRLHGLSCAVFDRRSLPLDKACGEGLLPRGVDHLENMGVTISGLRCAPLLGIRWVAGDVAADGFFSRRSGLGIRRLELVDALVERARVVGAELHYGQPVGPWRASGDRVLGVAGDHGFVARFLIGADGLHSAVRRDLGLELPAKGARRFGVRQHFRIPPWSPFLEVHLSDFCEAAVAPVAEDEIGVTRLGPGDGRPFLELMSSSFPTIAARLRGAEALDKPRGAGPFPRRVKRRYTGCVALVGDAAGYVDPITGEGLSLGFASALALVQTISAGRPLSEYERAYRRLSGGYDQITRAVLAITRRPWLRNRTVRMLSDNPDLLAGLLAVNDGDSWMAALGASGVARLTRGMLWSVPRIAGQGRSSLPEA
ncbi:MAG: NAD(P)/FAD-dependent oxidoreductase [Gemmatimonadota bacterium]